MGVDSLGWNPIINGGIVSILMIHTHTHMYGKAMRLGAEGSYLSDSERAQQSEVSRKERSQEEIPLGVSMVKHKSNQPCHLPAFIDPRGSNLWYIHRISA